MSLLPRGTLERVTLGLIGLLLVASLAVLSPAIQRWVRPAPVPSLTPTPSSTSAPQGVLFADELDRDLQSVVTVVVLTDAGLTFGTAVAVGAPGELLTSAQVMQNARAARVVDNTGGMHTVTVIGIDPTHGIALLGSAVVGTVPIAVGSTAGLQLKDPVAVLASPKNGSVPSNLPGSVTAIGTSATVGDTVVSPVFQLHADLWTGNAGSPVVGYGGSLLGIVLPGPALPTDAPMVAPVESAQADLKAWRAASGTALPLADLPPGLLFRGADQPTPSAGPSSAAWLSAIQPNQGHTGEDTTVVIQGSGFTAGAGARVHFAPISGSAGAFDARNASVNNTGSIAATIPAGQRVQDYAVTVTNGDGSAVSGSLAFTIVP